MIDPKISFILTNEYKRQSETVELIASENFASQAVMDLCGSVFTNKYAEGYPGKRYYNGCKEMDEIETLAIDSVQNCTTAYLQMYNLTVVSMQIRLCIKLS